MSTLGKVLYIEDEDGIRKNISEILKDEGFEVFQASDTKEGFSIFLKEKPDVILSDIRINGVEEGFDFLQKVRNSEGYLGRTPFIFITALGQKEDIILLRA